MMTGQPPVAGPRGADPWRAQAVRRRPGGAVWFVLIWFVFSGLLEAFLALVVYVAGIRDDQVHEGSVPTGLWVFFLVLVVAAVLNVVLGVFIFRGARWAWTTAVVVVALILVADVAAIVLVHGAADFIGAGRDIVTLRVLMGHQIREWCRPSQPEREWYAAAREKGG